MRNIEEVIKYFPQTIYAILTDTFESNPQMLEVLQEIRIRVGQPIILKLRNAEVVIQYVLTSQEILQTLERICDNSIYAYKNQIVEGYVTIRGGHRIGLVGTVVIENNEIINIKNVTSMNFRIARQVVDCSNKIIKEVLDLENQNIYNTLIVSPPGKGKTTILRDLIRKISNGVKDYEFRGKTCGVVDERGEIAAIYRGVPQNDLGIRTDVIENVSKSKGMKMLIRSMAPQVIACDEIGSKEDIIAIKEAISSGVKGIFTMHGKDMEDIKNNRDVYELVQYNIIEKIFFL